jgi:hypothetical protein
VLLSNGLADDGVRATKAIAEEEPFGACYQWCRGHAVRVMGDGKYESTCVLAAPPADETSFVLCAPLIVEVGVGTLHGIPQPGETGMKEAQFPDAAIGPVALEDADPPKNLSIGLAVIEDREADVMSTPDQLLA